MEARTEGQDKKRHLRIPVVGEGELGVGASLGVARRGGSQQMEDKWEQISGFGVLFFSEHDRDVQRVSHRSERDSKPGKSESWARGDNVT